MNGKLKAAVAALTIGLAASNSANAFSLYEGINLLEDDDFESQYVDNNGNNVLDVGDTLRGIMNITKIIGQSSPGLPSNLLGNSGTQLAAIFETKVMSFSDEKVDPVTGALTRDYVFGANTVNGLGTAVTFYSLNAETFPSSGAGCNSIATCESLITAGASKWWEFGFTYDATALTGDADEQWKSNDTPVNPDIFAGLSTSDAVGNFRFALSLINQNNAPTLGKYSLIGCGILYTCAGDGKVDFQGSGSVLGTNEILAQNPNFPYTVSSDTDMHINVIPEPSSLALLGIAAMGMGLSKRRAV